MMADEPDGTKVVESRLRGAFTGWKGDTEFELDNGQVWKQVHYAYMYQYSSRPEVTIYDVGGRYELHVDGVSGVLEVRKVR
jgi:hypothetical protein